MAEKRVSVRLAAVGGRQVRAELEGVGEAGKRGFGRLGQEMEAANARLAAFSRRVQLAAAAAVGAAAAAGLAMVRSGLQTVDAQAKLAQSLGTTVASIQTLERAGELAGVSMSGIEQATKDLTRRLSQAATGTGPAADALDRLGLSASDLIDLPLDQRVGAINAAIERFVPAAQRAAVAGQLFGEEGSIAMSRIDTATLRQATADILAFGVVVSEQDADQIERTNDAISRLGLVWRGLSNQLAVAAAPALEAVADAMAAVASRSGPLGIAIRSLFDNIGRLTTYAATFAAFLAGRWVAGMAIAALSVRGLATALVLLRGALIRTGIGALVVGAGELLYQFGRLVSGAGGLGEAMRLLGNVAREVWERIGMGAEAMGLALRSVFARIEALWLTVLSVLQKGWADFLHQVAETARSIPGLDETALALGNSAIRAGSGYYELAAAADAARVSADGLAQSARATAAAITASLASLAELSRHVDTATAETATGMQHASDATSEFADAITTASGASSTAEPAIARAPEAAASGWQNALAALDDYAGKASDVGRQVGDALVSAFNGVEEAVVKFATTGKLEVRALVDAILADLIRIQVRQLLLAPLARILGGLFGSAGAPSLPTVGMGRLYALGGVFAQTGELTAFARGGVVSRPALFPMARGVGLMGEAGPEAIMPLRRGAGGRLGVDAGGMAAAFATSMAPFLATVRELARGTDGRSSAVAPANVIVNAPPGTAVDDVRHRSDGSVEIDLVRTLDEGQADAIGGRGASARAMERRYGLNPVAGVPRRRRG